MTMLSHKSDLIAALAIGAVIGHQNGIQKYAVNWAAYMTNSHKAMKPHSETSFRKNLW